MTQATEAEISAEVREFVRAEVRGGYTELDEIVPAAVDYFTDTYDTELVGVLAEGALPEELKLLQDEQSAWPAVTDCDRLRTAFDRLRAKGVVARENFTCCQNCGHAEIGEEIDAEEATGLIARGYTFFHVQDTESVVKGGPLYLSFGTVENEDETLVVAADIVETLRSVGLNVDWSGTRDRRIHVTMNWQRRVATAG